VPPGYGTPITRAVLTWDPTWDAVRADLAFQKLCEKTTAPKIENVTVGAQRRQILCQGWDG